MEFNLMNYAGIKHCDMVDGPGLRVTLFVSGCDRHCDECHNPETHDPNYGKLFTEDTYNEIADELKESWNAGLTLCGGDPLYCSNRQAIAELVTRIKTEFPNKSIWMYTGYTLDQVLSMNDKYIDQILNGIDVILDGPYIKSLRSPDKQWVGSSNQNVYQIIHTEDGNQFKLI